MLSVEEIRALSTPNPEFQEIVEKGGVPAWTLDIAQARAMQAALKQMKIAAKPHLAAVSWTEEDEQITVRDGASIAVRIHRPKARRPGGCPATVMFHNGGFVIGDLEINGDLGHLFAASLGGLAVDVEYRHAPEHPFPTHVLDGFDALKWVVHNCAKLGINPKKGLLVGGPSSGADIALAVAHLYRDEVKKGSPPLTGIYAALTGATSEESVPDKYRDRFISMEQNAGAPLFNTGSLAFFRKLYKPDLRDPLAAPICPITRESPRLTSWPAARIP